VARFPDYPEILRSIATTFGSCRTIVSIRGTSFKVAVAIIDAAYTENDMARALLGARKMGSARRD
jgi:hypothetical protein